MKFLFLLIILFSCSSVFSQGLILSKNNKVKKIDLGSKVLLTNSSSHFQHSRDRHLYGTLIEVNQDSITIEMIRQKKYVSDDKSYKDVNYRYKANLPHYTIAKSSIQLIKLRNNKIKTPAIVASSILSISGISSLVDSQIITQSISREKLRNLGLIKLGSGFFGIMIAILPSKEFKILNQDGFWEIN